MIQIQNQIVSLDILNQDFVCNLHQCKGECCVAGDSGAPLAQNEKATLENELAEILPFLPEKGQNSIKSQGVGVTDEDGELVTPLNDGAECSFTVFDEKGMAHCGIERAWKAGKTTFRKPISCHLYPIRATQYPTFEALNYHRWPICDDACTLGKELQVPIYKFAKDALVRKYGEAWYSELEEAAESLEKMEQNNEATK